MMARRHLNRALLPCGLLVLALANGAANGAEATAAGIEQFERKIRPLLAEQCYKCHGEEKQKGGLRLDSPAAIAAGGETGPVIVTGKPADSRLILAVSYQDDELKMPPKTRLSPDQIKLLRDWVALGAPMPAVVANAQPAARETGFRIKPEDQRHWAFQPVKRPAVPVVKNTAWVRNPIDAFILARLETNGLAPNPAATRQELIRRASYDLTGLPPAPDAARRFVATEATDEWPRLVDQLLDPWLV